VHVDAHRGGTLEPLVGATDIGEMGDRVSDR
jgi:hypothetical protein